MSNIFGRIRDFITNLKAMLLFLGMAVIALSVGFSIYLSLHSFPFILIADAGIFCRTLLIAEISNVHSGCVCRFQSGVHRYSVSAFPDQNSVTAPNLQITESNEMKTDFQNMGVSFETGPFFCLMQKKRSRKTKQSYIA